MKRSFTAKSGLFPAEPDIFDFTDNTIYEITTPRLAYSRAVRLEAEVGLATSITSVADCGGRSWSRGWWSPKSMCFEMGGDEFISVANDAGVLVYTPLVARRRRREERRSAREAAQRGEGQLAASIDEENASHLSFNRPVSLQEAASYVWGSQSVPADAITRAPISMADPPVAGRQRQFILNLHGPEAMVLATRMQHGLYRQWQWASLLKSKGPSKLPDWVPEPLREAIFRGRVADGFSEFGGMWPGNFSGNVMVWISTGGLYKDIQVYQEYPEALEFYRRHAVDEMTARLYRDVFTEWNRDMRDLVGRSHYSPDYARGYLRYIHGEILKLVIMGAVMMLQAGASISTVNASMARQAAQQRQSISSGVRAGERLGSGNPPLRLLPGGGQGSGIPAGRLRDLDSLLQRPPDEVFDQAAVQLRAGGIR
jgi:hypothetical protein